MRNKEIRIAMLDAGVKQWQIARALGLHEASLSRKMRSELPETEQRKIFEIIEELSREDK